MTTQTPAAEIASSRGIPESAVTHRGTSGIYDGVEEDGAWYVLHRSKSALPTSGQPVSNPPSPPLASPSSPDLVSEHAQLVRDLEREFYRRAWRSLPLILLEVRGLLRSSSHSWCPNLSASVPFC